VTQGTNLPVNELVFASDAIKYAAHAVIRGENRPVPSTLLISGVVAAHAGKQPNKVALHADDGEEVTYAELNERVGGMARFLKKHGCGVGARVAVAGTRSVNTVIAFLALERIGGVYIPVSAEWPDTRLVQVLSQARCSHLLSLAEDVPNQHVEHSLLATVAARSRVLFMETVKPLVENLWVGDVPTHAESDKQQRYVIHTSGSTGLPKGAIVEHGALINHLWHMNVALELGPTDVVAFNSPPTYVISMWQMLAGLLVGGSVAVISEREAKFPRSHSRALQQLGVSIVQLVPTILGLFLEELGKHASEDRIPRVRWIISTGEELSPKLAARVFDVLPTARLMNAYGMSECSDDVAQHVLEFDDLKLRRIPIGLPIGNTALYVLVRDPGGWRPAAEGEAGELFVGGRPVGAGYVGSDERAGDSFFRDPFDPFSPTMRLYRTGDMARIERGVVYCLGRMDRQVKVRGVRVELDEVEHALERHPHVIQCAITAETQGESMELRAYVLAKEQVPNEELRSFLRKQIPSAMVPRYWNMVSEIPVTRSGKTDYKMLQRTRQRADDR